jgi:hypothetical protein
MKHEVGADIFMLLKYDDEGEDRKVNTWYGLSSEITARIH